MHLNFEGRTALVTGAAQGIGQAIARALSAAGARVHVADLDADRLNRFAAQNAMVPHVLDVGDRAAGHALVEQVVILDERLDIW